MSTSGSSRSIPETYDDLLEICDHECPLRRPYEPQLDPVLPETSSSLPHTREEVCARLHGDIKEWQTRLLVLAPGQIGSDLFGDLVVADLAHFTGAVLHEQQRRVQYTALS